MEAGSTHPRNLGVFSGSRHSDAAGKGFQRYLYSLNPRVDRLAMSVIMHISRDGEVRDYSVHNSVIHSKERMTYEDVQLMIDGDPAMIARYRHIMVLFEINKLRSIRRSRNFCRTRIRKLSVNPRV